MKKIATATALALLITGCAQQTFVQNKPAAVAPKEIHHPSFLRFWNWAEETVDAAKICGGAENVVKTETQQMVRKWIARFYYFRHLYSTARVLLTIIARVAHRYGQLYLHCSLIYWLLPVVFA